MWPAESVPLTRDARCCTLPRSLTDSSSFATTDAGSHITYEMEFVGPALKGPMAGMLEKQAGAAGKQALEKLVALVD